jgi:hypothetical protein
VILNNITAVTKTAITGNAVFVCIFIN